MAATPKASMPAVLDQFLEVCRKHAAGASCHAELAAELCPLMKQLVAQADDFLGAAQRRPDPEHYARHPVYICPDGGLSLFSMVWRPGQWTPVHDHGTWGVVGVVQGMLEERGFVRTDTAGADAASGIQLKRGGSVMLCEGSVSTFVPDPDHIHRTGVPEGGSEAVTLHLYGREMNAFHEYDLEAGTRRLINAAYAQP